jgi:hypothetical protein
MKLISIIYVLTSVASISACRALIDNVTPYAAERGLQALSKKWNIIDPSFTYDALGFLDLDYQVTDSIDNAHTLHTIWTSPGCQKTGVPVPPSVLTSTRPILTGHAYNPYISGDHGVRDQKLTFGMVPANITASDIYVEDTNVDSFNATIDFCVRFSLVTAEAVEVNYLETLVTLFVDLSDGFAIADVNVTPKIKIQNTANQEYLLEAYQCDAANAELTGTDLVAKRLSGSVIRVCVKPDAEAVTAGLKMRSLDEFTFTRDLDPVGPDAGDLNQTAIIGYNLESDNGLTVLTCSNGVDVCVFETILFAVFYSNLPGVVLGSGTGSMQFGSGARRLGSQVHRSNLAAITWSDFELASEVDDGVYIGCGDPRERDPDPPNDSDDPTNDSGGATKNAVGVMAATVFIVMAGASFGLIV